MKRLSSIGMLLSATTGLLVVMLVSVFAYSALDAFRRAEKVHTVLSDIADIRQILSTESQVRLELGVANLLLDAPRPANAHDTARLTQMQRDADRMVHIAIAEAAASSLTDSRAAAVDLRQYDDALHALLPHVYVMITRSRGARDPEVFAAWKEVTTAFTRQLSAEALLLEEETTGTDPFIDATLRISDAAWDLRMEAGRERGYVQTAIIDNRVPSLASLEYLAQLKGMALAHWNTIQGLAQRSTMPVRIKQAVAEAAQDYFGHQMGIRDASSPI